MSRSTFTRAVCPRSPLLAFLLLALVACGGSGGGGGGGGPGPVPFAGVDVAFIADGRAAVTFELWVADGAGMNPRVVSGPLIVGTQVNEFAWSPDRQRLAFVSNRAGGGNRELYLADADGGAPLKISLPTPPAWTNVRQIAWSADSTMVGYLADEDDPFEDDMFVAFVSGATRRRVSPASAAVDGTVKSFRWQPVGDVLAYVGDLDVFTFDHLRVFDASNLSEGVVTLPGLAFGDVTSYRWAPNGSRIAYQFDGTTAGLNQTLHTVLPDGAGFVSLSDVSVPMADASHYEWAPNSLRIAFLTDEDAVGLPEIWSSLAAGGSKVKIGPAESIALSVTPTFAWSPDSTKLAFVREHSLTETELWVNSALGGALVNVFPSSGSTDVTGIQWSPDSGRLALRADPDVDTRYELWVVGAGGAGSHQVSHDMPSYGGVAQFGWIPGNDWLLYSADEAADNQFDLFVAAGTGTYVEPVTSVASPVSGVSFFFMVASPAGAFYLSGLGGLPRHLNRYVLFGGVNGVTSPLVPALTEIVAVATK